MRVQIVSQQYYVYYNLVANGITPEKKLICLGIQFEGCHFPYRHIDSRLYQNIKRIMELSSLWYVSTEAINFFDCVIVFVLNILASFYSDEYHFYSWMILNCILCKVFKIKFSSLPMLGPIMSLGWFVLMAFILRFTAWGPMPGGKGPAPGCPGTPGVPGQN